MKFFIAIVLLFSWPTVAKEQAVGTTIHVVRSESRGKGTVVYATFHDAHVKLDCVPQPKMGCGWLEPGDYPAEVTDNGKSIWIIGRGMFDARLGKQHYTYSGGW